MRPNFLLLFGLAAALSVAVSLVYGQHLAALPLSLVQLLRGNGALGLALAAALIFAVALAGIVPGALLGIAAGALFGVLNGFCAASLGILAGAAAAFGLSRSVLRPAIGALLARHGAMARLDGAITTDGWRLVALLRISPIMPFSVTSYALGFSGISFSGYMLGTLASLPPLLGYVAIGALGSSGARLAPGAGRDIHQALLGLGAVATLALIWHLTRLLGRVLRPA